MLKSIIIDNSQQYQDFINQLPNSDIIIHPVCIDNNQHVLHNNLSITYIYLIDLQQGYIFIHQHQEDYYIVSKQQLYLDINTYNNNHNKFTIDKKQLIHLLTGQDLNNLIDSQLLYYFKTNNTYNLKLPSINFYIDNNKINVFLTPITKLIEYCEQYVDINLQLINNNQELITDQGFIFYNDTIINNFVNVEQSGLYIDKPKAITIFENNIEPYIVDDNTVFTEYNLLTLTGRPSNKYGGVNYAALNKTDGSREIFLSRFKDNDGYLFEIDFDAYHLMLISKLINYKIPSELNVHEYLGRYYFGKEDNVALTEDEYNESKNISFKIIYGNHIQEYQEIPFFKQTSEFIQELWKQFETKGYVESKITKRRLLKENYNNIYDSKLFNYYIQMIETEFSAIVIKEVFKIFTIYTYMSKLILYTYDSFLFDCSKEDKDLIPNILQVFNNSGFKYKTKQGNNYSKLEKFNVT
jgi:hypothetical protein